MTSRASIGTETSTTVAVVGAGIAGLVAARALDRRGIGVSVLESANRPGGRVLTDTSALGSRLDLGGQWIGHGHHRFGDLATTFGATVFGMHTPRRPLVVDGQRTVSGVGATMLMANLDLIAWEFRARVRPPERWDALSFETWRRRVPGARARRLLGVLGLSPPAPTSTGPACTPSSTSSATKAGSRR